MPDQLGAFAAAARTREEQLVQRLVTSVELDGRFEGILRGAHQHNVQARQRLDAIEAAIRQAAASWPGLDTPAGARQFQTFLVGKTREIHQVVSDAAADSQQRSAQVQALTERYRAPEDLASSGPKGPTGPDGANQSAQMVGFGHGIGNPQSPPFKPDPSDPPMPQPPTGHPLSELPPELGGRPSGETPQVPPVKFGPYWVPPEVAEAGTQWINNHVPNRTPAEWTQALSDTLGAGYAKGQQEQVIRVLQAAQAGQCSVDDAARSLFALGLDGLGVAGAVPLAEAPPIAIVAAAGALGDGVLNIGDIIRCLSGST
ncbi:DUF4226 domain-containing protein [Mycobacterium sp. SVM_VP21]|nr:DUF4226 domain-containing protein [Mycobacterium sp. SVM_VP21]